MAAGCRFGGMPHPEDIDTFEMEGLSDRAAPSNASASDAPTILSPLLKLPRELRDQIYTHIFHHHHDGQSRESLHIERCHLRRFRHSTPSPATILLLLRYTSLLLSSQICSEALEVLFKRHTILLSGGPFVLTSLLSSIEETHRDGRKWLGWITSIELDWVTFPNLSKYHEWRWELENDEVEVDPDYVRGVQYSGHYDEYDYEGSGYDDNYYEPGNAALNPNFNNTQQSFTQAPAPADPFGFSTHYPYGDPSLVTSSSNNFQADSNIDFYSDRIFTNLDLLVEMEVTPLFDYLATPTFSSLRSITLPLYFTKQTYHPRNTSRPGRGLPWKLEYWIHVAVHALHMLHSPPLDFPHLEEVRVRYMPKDVWVAMNPSDDLGGMVEQGVWFRDGEDGATEGEGEAFKAIWQGLAERGVDVHEGGLDADLKLVKWDGDLSGRRVGDELEVVFKRAKLSIASSS